MIDRRRGARSGESGGFGSEIVRAQSGERGAGAPYGPDELLVDGLSPNDEITIEDPKPIGEGDDLIIEDDLRRRSLFGLDFVDAADLSTVADAVLAGPYRTSALPAVVTPNVDILVHLDRKAGEKVQDFFRRAQFCLPDGQPVVLASKLVGQPLSARLPGSGLFEILWPRLCREGRPVVVVASSEEIGRGLSADHGAVSVVVPPMIAVDDENGFDRLADQVVRLATTIGAQMVLSGLGHPKDALILSRVIDRWPNWPGEAPMCLALGGSFAMQLGLVKRAPAWVQRVGLEWFHRFCQEPRRLFRRYFVHDLAFFGLVADEVMESKGRARGRQRRT